VNIMLTISKKQSAMTLSELLVATILVGIVMVGVVSVDYAIRNMQNFTTRDSQLTMESSAAMMQINRDALLIMGDNSNPPDSWGIYSSSTLTPESIICFHQDVNNDLTLDGWTCYCHGSSLDLWRCPNKSDKMTSCSNSGCTKILELSEAAKFDIITNNDNKFLYVDICLNSIVDQSNSAHPIDNPTGEQCNRINPPALSR
jgi:Tfp pilus assembly protein PilV